jgi:hypothetical protein
MSYSAQVENMLRNFEQIDKPQPKVEFKPLKEDFCLLTDGKSDGYIYHYPTIVEMVNNGFSLEKNQEFKCMVAMSVEELQHFLSVQKI